MFKKIWDGIVSAFRYLRNAFTQKQVAGMAAVSSEETFLGEAPEEKAEVMADKVVTWGARIFGVMMTYIVVMNFPLTILFVIEMVAVYKAMTWAVKRIMAPAPVEQ